MAVLKSARMIPAWFALTSLCAGCATAPKVIPAPLPADVVALMQDCEEPVLTHDPPVDWVLSERGRLCERADKKGLRAYAARLAANVPEAPERPWWRFWN